MSDGPDIGFFNWIRTLVFSMDRDGFQWIWNNVFKESGTRFSMDLERLSRNLEKVFRGPGFIWILERTGFSWIWIRVAA